MLKVPRILWYSAIIYYLCRLYGSFSQSLCIWQRISYCNLQYVCDKIVILSNNLFISFGNILTKKQSQGHLNFSDRGSQTWWDVPSFLCNVSMRPVICSAPAARMLRTYARFRVYWSINPIFKTFDTAGYILYWCREVKADSILLQCSWIKTLGADDALEVTFSSCVTFSWSESHHGDWPMGAKKTERPHPQQEASGSDSTTHITHTSRLIS